MDDVTFDLEIHVGGCFVEEPTIQYVGGSVRLLTEIDPDKLSYFEIRDLCHLVGAPKEHSRYKYLIPDGDLQHDLRDIETDTDVVNMTNLHKAWYAEKIIIYTDIDVEPLAVEYPDAGGVADGGVGGDAGGAAGGVAGGVGGDAGRVADGVGGHAGGDVSGDAARVEIELDSDDDEDDENDDESDDEEDVEDVDIDARDEEQNAEGDDDDDDDDWLNEGLEGDGFGDDVFAAQNSAPQGSAPNTNPESSNAPHTAPESSNAPHTDPEWAEPPLRMTW
ncbi:uncharacterized protein LOC126722276 [Quercus robur]|uniref:uncharacterized protein LOC126722276 n=1 Tax=Quercus robur TaxID=38942 RepID=UPI0021620D63|nr:uncharacterized protein LOC126722276 [Quercus robur]